MNVHRVAAAASRTPGATPARPAQNRQTRRETRVLCRGSSSAARWVTLACVLAALAAPAAARVTRIVIDEVKPLADAWREAARDAVEGLLGGPPT